MHIPKEKSIKRTLTFLLMILSILGVKLKGADSTFMDYQNYNHGYCPECSCYPCKCDISPPYAQPHDCNSCHSNPCSCSPPPCDPCPVPNPCDPCPAPVCGTQCGVSVIAIGIAIAAVAATAAIIISSGGSSTAHAANP